MELVPVGPQTIQRTVEILKRGGVIAHPADTCFGLAADFTNRDAVKKVQAIKGRHGGKPMSLMFPAAFFPQLTKYVELDDFTWRLCDELFPGAVTILLPKGPKIPKWYFPETKLVGIRTPFDEFTQDLLNAFKAPLVTTSANPSGKALCHTHQEVMTGFKKSKVQPDLVIQGSLPQGNLASTVILPEKNRVKIMRHGPMSAKEIEEILGIQVVG